MSPLTNSCLGWSINPSRFSSRPAYVSLSSVVTRQSECADTAWRTKLEPMKPAPPVTRTSTIFARPVVRQRTVRRDSALVRLGAVVRLVRHVDDQRWLDADAFPAVVDTAGHLDEQRAVHAEEEFVDDVA